MDRLERISYFGNVLGEDAAYNALCLRRELLGRTRGLAGRYLPD